MKGNLELTTIAALSGIQGPTGSIAVETNPKLASLGGLERITEVTGNMGVSVRANDMLASVSALQNITRVGGKLVLSSNPALTTISMPLLGEVHYDVEVTDDATLANVAFAKLAKVGGGVIVSSNGAMTGLDFPSLTTAVTVFVENDASLVSLGFPALVTITSTVPLRIVNDQSLKACLVEKLGQQLQPPRTLSTTGDNGAGTCP